MVAWVYLVLTYEHNWSFPFMSVLSKISPFSFLVEEEDRQYDEECAEKQDEITRTYFKNREIMKRGETEEERQNASKIVKAIDDRDKKVMGGFKGFKSSRF